MIGKVFKHFDELASTNTFATELLAKSNPTEGTVISAAFQTAGRGQMGTRWESQQEQNVTLSVILFPTFIPLQEQFLLSQAVALAVRDAVQFFLPQQEIRVKWPNDILVGSKKIAGILIQNHLTGRQWQSAVVGIGWNIGQRIFQSAEQQVTTSLALEADGFFDLSEVRTSLFWYLELRYQQLKDNFWTEIRLEYLQHLYRRGELSRFFEKENNQIFVGKIMDTTPDGRLRIEIADEIRSFEVKEIQLLGSL